jgi:hypothetical protein
MLRKYLKRARIEGARIDSLAYKGIQSGALPGD